LDLDLSPTAEAELSEQYRYGAPEKIVPDPSRGPSPLDYGNHVDVKLKNSCGF
jgi:hypothetical protein